MEEQLLEAAIIREDDVAQRINQVPLCDVVYHVNNNCYKKYTRKKDLDRVRKRKIDPLKHETPHEEETTVKVARTRASVTGRYPPSKDEHSFRKLCVICAKQKSKGTFEKFRISETARAEKFLEATKFFQDEVFTRTCDLEGAEAVFGADLYCHSNCISGYLLQYERSQEDRKGKESCSRKSSVLSEVLNSINIGLMLREGYELSNIRDMANTMLGGETFNNKEHYGEESICFTQPLEVNKSEMTFF